MTVHDLNLPDHELSQLTTALANAGVVQPLDDIIAWAAQVVADKTLGYTLAEIRRVGFVRDLAIWRAYTLAGAVSENQQRAYDEAMKEMNLIASGQSKLPKDDTAPEPAYLGAWGSRANILPEADT